MILFLRSSFSLLLIPFLCVYITEHSPKPLAGF